MLLSRDHLGIDHLERLFCTDNNGLLPTLVTPLAPLAQPPRGDSHHNFDSHRLLVLLVRHHPYTRFPIGTTSTAICYATLFSLCPAFTLVVSPFCPCGATQLAWPFNSPLARVFIRCPCSAGFSPGSSFSRCLRCGKFLCFFRPTFGIYGWDLFNWFGILL